MKKGLMILGVLALSLLLFSPESMAQKFDLKLMTGPMGGSWYPLGGAISDSFQKDIPGLTLAVMPGGESNNERWIIQNTGLDQLRNRCGDGFLPPLYRRLWSA
jgi:TRAP-type uncharacterized transport system substrate-binding protein